MEDHRRGCAAHGKAWKILEGTGRMLKALESSGLMVCAWILVDD